MADDLDGTLGSLRFRPAMSSTPRRRRTEAPVYESRRGAPPFALPSSSDEDTDDGNHHVGQTRGFPDHAVSLVGQKQDYFRYDTPNEHGNLYMSRQGTSMSQYAKIGGVGQDDDDVNSEDDEGESLADFAAKILARHGLSKPASRDIRSVRLSTQATSSELESPNKRTPFDLNSSLEELRLLRARVAALDSRQQQAHAILSTSSAVEETNKKQTDRASVHNYLQEPFVTRTAEARAELPTVDVIPMSGDEDNIQYTQPLEQSIATEITANKLPDVISAAQESLQDISHKEPDTASKLTEDEITSAPLFDSPFRRSSVCSVTISAAQQSLQDKSHKEPDIASKLTKDEITSAPLFDSPFRRSSVCSVTISAAQQSLQDKSHKEPDTASKLTKDEITSAPLFDSPFRRSSVCSVAEHIHPQSSDHDYTLPAISGEATNDNKRLATSMHEVAVSQNENSVFPAKHPIGSEVEANESFLSRTDAAWKDAAPMTANDGLVKALNRLDAAREQSAATDETTAIPNRTEVAGGAVGGTCAGLSGPPPVSEVVASRRARQRLNKAQPLTHKEWLAKKRSDKRLRDQQAAAESQSRVQNTSAIHARRVDADKAFLEWLRKREARIAREEKAAATAAATAAALEQQRKAKIEKESAEAFEQWLAGKDVTERQKEAEAAAKKEAAKKLEHEKKLVAHKAYAKWKRSTTTRKLPSETWVNPKPWVHPVPPQPEDDGDCNSNQPKNHKKNKKTKKMPGKLPKGLRSEWQSPPLLHRMHDFGIRQR